MLTSIDTHRVTDVETIVKKFNGFTAIDIIVTTQDGVTEDEHKTLTLTLFVKDDGTEYVEGTVVRQVLNGLAMPTVIDHRSELVDA